MENLPTRFQRQIVTTSPYATNQIVVEGEKRQVFSFDNVFPPETTQDEIYDKSVENLVSKFIEGNINQMILSKIPGGLSDYIKIYYSFSRRIQCNNISIWSNIFRKNTYNGYS